MNAYCEKSHKAQSSQSIVAAALDSTVDAVTTVGKLTVDAVTAVGQRTVDAATAVGQRTVDVATAGGQLSIAMITALFWPISSTNSYEKQMSKYNINLDLYLQNSVVKKLNQEQKLLICAAAASLPPPGGPNDNENNRKILIAFLASNILVASGVAIVVCTGSSGLLVTLLLEMGKTGIENCIKTIESNEKFLWKEWSYDILKTGVETLVLGAARFGVRGPVTKKIINALCSLYDIIESSKNVVICIIEGNYREEIAFQVLKSNFKSFELYITYAEILYFQIKAVFRIKGYKPIDYKPNEYFGEDLDRPIGPYAMFERVINNIRFIIYRF